MPVTFELHDHDIRKGENIKPRFTRTEDHINRHRAQGTVLEDRKKTDNDPPETKR